MSTDRPADADVPPGADRTPEPPPAPSADGLPEFNLDEGPEEADQHCYHQQHFSDEETQELPELHLDDDAEGPVPRRDGSGDPDLGAHRPPELDLDLPSDCVPEWPGASHSSADAGRESSSDRSAHVPDDVAVEVDPAVGDSGTEPSDPEPFDQDETRHVLEQIGEAFAPGVHGAAEERRARGLSGELSTAELLADEGADVTLLDEDHGQEGVKNIDAIVRYGAEDPGRFTELKHKESGTPGSIRRSIQEAQAQLAKEGGGDAVIDGRGADLQRSAATTGITDALRQHEDLGRGMPERVRVVLGDGSSVYWPEEW